MTFVAVVADMALGFAVALWIGFFLGVLEAASWRAYLTVLATLAVVILASVVAEGGDAASSINWAVVVGTMPGYALSVPAGRTFYHRKTRGGS